MSGSQIYRQMRWLRLSTSIGVFLAFLPELYLMLYGTAASNRGYTPLVRAFRTTTTFRSKGSLRSLKVYLRCQQISTQKSTPLISDFRGHVWW